MGADLTTREVIRLVIVYSSATVPLLVILFLGIRKKLPFWIINLYFLSILICALGWETWFTFGWVDGADVNSRRGPALNTALPQSINWLMNSLADGAIALIGLLASWLAYGKKEQMLQRWHWAPLAPNGPYYNPVLFSLGDRSVSLQGQIPSLLMTPLFYWLSIKIYTRHKIRVSQTGQND